jgi:hypothetical protein
MQEKIDFEVSEIREATKAMDVNIDIDSEFTFFYDESNNIRKFHVKEDDFNSPFEGSFILGGLVVKGCIPDIDPLFESLKLQSSIKEVKLKHIAKGDFLECLKSPKLEKILSYLLQEKFYIHFSSINLLYWSIVDIIESVIVEMNGEKQYFFILSERLLKDILYDLIRDNIPSFIKIFYKYSYPNIQREHVESFLNEIIDESKKYNNDPLLQKLLNQASTLKELPFIMDEEDHILIESFFDFYFRPLYLFINSNHIFDNEIQISNKLSEFQLLNNGVKIDNYTFEDSVTNRYIQISDVLMGLFGKMFIFINQTTHEDIKKELIGLNNQQSKNLNLLNKLIDQSNSINTGFFHSIDAKRELEKRRTIFTYS